VVVVVMIGMRVVNSQLEEIKKRRENVCESWVFHFINYSQSVALATERVHHTINTIYSKTYHSLEKVTKIHKRQVYNPKNE
jgi:hypothetical protein